jgi:sRNA-binding carbon storage regulator CsrA
MQRLDGTIGYAIKFGDHIEIRVLNDRGIQRRVGINAAAELFANNKSIFERIEAEKRATRKLS